MFQRVRRYWIAPLLAVFLIGAFLGMRRCEHKWRKGNVVPLLAAALNTYHQQHGGLPDTLEPVLNKGLFGLTGSCMDDRAACVNGVSVIYVKADTPGLIVLIESSGEDRGYVVLGNTSAHLVGENAVSGLLRNDDKARAAAREKLRWR